MCMYCKFYFYQRTYFANFILNLCFRILKSIPNVLSYIFNPLPASNCYENIQLMFVHDLMTSFCVQETSQVNSSEIPVSRAGSLVLQRLCKINVILFMEKII